MIDIKNEVINDKTVKFVFYRDGALWYKTDSGAMFPVPLEDIGNATFLAEDKALLFMRYMRNFNQITN